MTPAEQRMFARLVGTLAERFSGTGHLMAHIAHENRGHCPHNECSLRCTTYRALFHEACDLLEAALAGEERVEQGALFGSEVAG